MVTQPSGFPRAAAEPRVRLRLSADEGAPALARDALGALAGRLSAERLESLELVASELVTNAVRHGTESDREEITLTADLQANAVAVTVTDPGSGFDPAAPRPQPGSGGGFGLYLVQELAAAWQVERRPEGTRVTARLAR